MHTYTVPEVIDLLRKAVAEKGEGYVYPRPPNEDGNEEESCVYEYETPDGEVVHCLAGKVIYQIVSPPVWGQIVRHSNAEGVWYRQIADLLPLSKDAHAILRETQQSQDAGDSWGTALQNAVDKASQLGYTV